MIRFKILACLLLVNLGVFAQPKKIVEVVVVGTGVTTDAALQNAFKKAIEQSFGTFVSTKTEILNDEITKNELVSVSNGNIQNYEVLSTAKLNEKEFSTTVKVSVSISNLVSFVKSKGISAEIKGSILSANILQQEFNEANELKATNELMNTLAGILNKSFDYSVKIDEPTMGDAGLWNIPLTTTVQPNDNIKVFKQFLSKSLAGLSMTPEEAANYVKLNKPVYKVAMGDESYFEGTGVSRELFIVSNRTTLTKNNIPQISINRSELKKLNELKDKKFYICYSLSGSSVKIPLDTIFATTNNLEDEVNKIREQLNAEAEIKLRGGSYWYYTPGMMNFTPVVYWCDNDFNAPVYYFRNKTSFELVQYFFSNTIKEILFDVTIKNEINTISGIELLIKHLDPKYGSRYLQILDNNFKLDFNYILHKSKIPIRLNYLTPYNSVYGYERITDFKLDEYLVFGNLYERLKNGSVTLNSTPNQAKDYDFITYPFFDYLKFNSIQNPWINPIVLNTRGYEARRGEIYYNFLLTLDSFKEQQPLFSYKFIDKVTKDDLSKISNYSIEHNQAKSGGY